MRIVFLDSTGIVPSGPGSPAFFSRYAIEHLKSLGHDVVIASGFDPTTCRAADAVVTEWANEDAFEAAASGVCKRLIVRLRGYDAFMQLDKLAWNNVDALVYESPFLKQLVEERFPGLRGFRSHVIPSGIDVANIPFKERPPIPAGWQPEPLVIAMVARGIADKGYQLAWEWARRQPQQIQLHAALAMPEPRLLRYLEHTKPPNVTMYAQVDTVKWLHEIGAHCLLSASHWESLGYTVAEAMACGVKVLMHDTPGAGLNWPPHLVERWTDFDDLDDLVRPYGTYRGQECRAFVEENLDAAKQSARFADLVLSLPARASSPARRETFGRLIAVANNALAQGNLEVADQVITRFRAEAPAQAGLTDHRVGLALMLGARYYAADNLAMARTWALRSMADEARPDAMCLLGEIALAEDDVEGAERWYTATALVKPVPSHYGLPDLVGTRNTRLAKILRLVDPDLTPGQVPDRYLIVAAVRNAEKYIGQSLASVKALTHNLWKCVVIDDASTDGTLGAIADAVGTTTLDTRFFVHERRTRQWSLRNIVDTIRSAGRPGDVVVILDGDDELKPHALQHFDAAYRGGAWLTYGNFVSSSGKPSWMPAYPQRVLRDGAVRDYPWQVSHPKTFRFELFNHLTDEDFTHEGKWFQTAGDVALMLPMLELAGERAMYIPDVLYVYNDENAANDHKVDPDGQVRVRDLIYAKPRKTKLEEL